MASSGTFYTNYYNSTIRLKLSWTSTQSIANNATTIKWTLTSNGGSTGSWWMSAPITVTIGGKTVLSITKRFKMYGGGAFKKTGSVAITHNEDGTKSCAMSVKAAIYSASVNCTGSKTYTLDKIDRYALLTSVQNFTDDVANAGYPTIEYTNPAGATLVSDVKVRITWNNGNGYTSWHSLDNSGADSPYTFDSSSLSSNDIDNMLQFCSDSNTLPIKFDLQSTLDGTEYHHYMDAVMTIVNANPVMGTLSYDDANPDVVDITGSTPSNPIIVQKQSTLRISFTPATAQKGARISSYSMNFNGILSAIFVGLHDDGGHFDFEKPDFAGTYDAILRATDTRGNVSISTISVTITAWQEPSAEISLERVNGFETDTVLHVKATISAVTGSSLTIEERHRIVNGTWSALAGVQNDTDETIALNNQYEWEMEVHVSDAFYTIIYLKTVGKGIPIGFIDTDMNSIGFGCFPDDDDQVAVSKHIKIKPNDTDNVVLPHKYSETEQVVGYWLDGRPIYEKTIVLTSAITVAAGNTSSAGAWTTLDSGWTNPVRILDIKCYHEDSAGGALWTHLSANWTSNEIRVLNVRSVSLLVEAFTVQYIYGTFN